MGMALKRSLVFVLAMALFIAGMPFAHATDAAALPSKMMHHHDAMPGAAANHHQDNHGKLAPDQCKCLNCGLCGTPGVTALVREFVPERRVLAVTYRPFSTERPDVSISVDPGIPICLT
jgi:putative hemolysin